ncbi:hypothetical protein ACTXT7_010427 [Hymenolepis weldensis]
MLRLLVEYEVTPIVPAPFSLFQLLYEAIACTYGSCIKRHQRSKRIKRRHTLFPLSALMMKQTNNIEVGRMVEKSDGIGEGNRKTDEELDSLDQDIVHYKNSVVQMQSWAVPQVFHQKAYKAAGGINNTYRISINGSKSYIDPRLSLPFSRFSNGRPLKNLRLDSLATISEVLNDCEVAGKFVIILGGTSGIGLGLTKSLIQHGVNIICLSREPPPVKWLPFPSIDNFKISPGSHLFWTHLDLTCLQTAIDFAEIGMAYRFDYNLSGLPA